VPVSEQHGTHGRDDDARLAGLELRHLAFSDRLCEPQPVFALVHQCRDVTAGQGVESRAGSPLLEHYTQALELCARGVDHHIEFAGLADGLPRLNDLDDGAGSASGHDPGYACSQSREYEERQQFFHKSEF